VVFTSRGFFIDSVLVDGVPAASNSSTESADETLDTGLYERIEIVRGATGLLTGAGSPSASVNLVRKRADARALTASIDATAGSWDDRRAVLDLGGPLLGDGAVRGRVVGVYQHRESYQAFYENEKQVLYGIVDADLGENTLLSLSVDYQDVQPQANTWGSFPLFLSDGSRTDWNRSVSTAADWSFWNKRRRSVIAELRHDFGPDWSLRGSLTRRRADDDLALFYVFGYPDVDDGTGLVPFAYREIVQTDQRALDLYVSGPFDLFGRRHELVAGFNGSEIEVDGTEFAPGELADTGNFFEWDASYPIPAFAATGTTSTDRKTRQQGLYAAARLSVTDPLTLVAGARVNRWKTDDFYVYSGPEAFVHDHRQTTPYAGLIYDLDATWSAFVSYTEIFDPQNSQDPDGQFLDPITGKSSEVGIKGEHFGGRFNTALTLFDTRQDNVAVPAIDDQGQPIFLPDGITQASFAVDGTQTRGFELEASGSPLPGWNASLGWSRYLLEDGEGNSVKGYIPRTLVRVFSTYTPRGALHRLTMGGGVNWQSASDLDVGAPQGLVNIRQGSVPLLSLMTRYRVSSAMSVQLNGNNLLDRKYYVLDEYGNLYFGAPASVAASLSYQF
jgi:outer membrane receptor for ferric coprogen and ferric-rhodotorulic acid